MRKHDSDNSAALGALCNSAAATARYESSLRLATLRSPSIPTSPKTKRRGLPEEPSAQCILARATYRPLNQLATSPVDRSATDRGGISLRYRLARTESGFPPRVVRRL